MSFFLLILELIGTCAFAISGAVIAIQKRLDVFGVIFCSVVTALGGGVIRDILVPNLPPVMFRKMIYFNVAVASALLTFLLAKIWKDRFLKSVEQIDSIINIFDAIGLGVFTIIGINTGIASGYGENAFFVIFLGMTTGCGGGILRDILVREVPFVFTKRIYALASIVGGAMYYLLFVTLQYGQFLSVLCGIATIFILRVLAAIFRWNLPKALP